MITAEPPFFAAIREAFADAPEESLDDSGPAENPPADDATRAVLGRLIEEHETLEESLEATIAERDQLKAELAELRAQQVAASFPVAAPGEPRPDESGNLTPDSSGSASEPAWTKESLSAEVAARGWYLSRCVFNDDPEKAMTSPFAAGRQVDAKQAHGSTPESLIAAIETTDRKEPAAPRVKVTHGAISTSDLGARR